MKTDNYTKFILTVIALGLFINAGVDLIEPAQAKDDRSLQIQNLSVKDLNVRLATELLNNLHQSEARIIEQILYCIDQSKLDGWVGQGTGKMFVSLQMQQCEWQYPSNKRPILEIGANRINAKENAYFYSK